MKKLISSLLAVTCLLSSGFTFNTVTSFDKNTLTANAAEATVSFKTYELSNKELEEITTICMREVGSADKVADMASFIANRYELHNKNSSSIYDYVMHSGWFSIPKTLDTSNVSDDAVGIVHSVLVDGKRTLPLFIDEMDYTGDISYVENDGIKFDKNETNSYVSLKTIVHNLYGGSYTYYKFINSTDVFGCSDTSLIANYNYYYDSSINEFVFGDNTVNSTTEFTAYNLTEQQLSELAYICYREAGDAKGAAAEASLMANRFELYGSKYSTLYEYVKQSGWFALANKATGTAPSDVIEACKKVFIEGKRTIPYYVTEHDWIGDISKATNDEVKINLSDRLSYIPFKTVITNVYGSSYIFYSFTTDTSDPYGYRESEESLIDSWNFYYDFETGERITVGTAKETLIRGDANGDGKVDIIDVITINKTIMGKESMSAEAVKAVDTNNNGVPDSTDSLNVMKYIVGFIDSLD